MPQCFGTEMFQSFEFNKLPRTAPDAGATKPLQCWLDLQELPSGGEKAQAQHLNYIRAGLGVGQGWVSGVGGCGSVVGGGAVWRRGNNQS